VLEDRALESVHRAAPFDAPSSQLLRGGSVHFLETFLFRDDGRFQIRSLVQTPG
jgi:protein TonB